MHDHCWCGDGLSHFYESWRCVACGRPCCPACAEPAGTGATCLPCTGEERRRAGRAR